MKGIPRWPRSPRGWMRRVRALERLWPAVATKNRSPTRTHVPLPMKMPTLGSSMTRATDRSEDEVRHRLGGFHTAGRHWQVPTVARLHRLTDAQRILSSPARPTALTERSEPRRNGRVRCNEVVGRLGRMPRSLGASWHCSHSLPFDLSVRSHKDISAPIGPAHHAREKVTRRSSFDQPRARTTRLRHTGRATRHQRLRSAPDQRRNLVTEPSGATMCARTKAKKLPNAAVTEATPMRR